MTVKSTQEVGERGRRNGDGPRFGLWTGHHHSRSAAPVDDSAGGSCTAARESNAWQATHPMPVCSSGARPAAACWAARSDVGGPQNAASGGGVGRAVRHARRMQQQAAASPPAGGSTYSRTAVARRPPRRLCWITATCADGTRSRGAVLRAGGASSWAFKKAPSCVCNNVQQASQRHAPTGPLRRETYERKRRVLGADCKRPARVASDGQAVRVAVQNSNCTVVRDVMSVRCPWNVRGVVSRRPSS